MTESCNDRGVEPFELSGGLEVVLCSSQRLHPQLCAHFLLEIGCKLGNTIGEALGRYPEVLHPLINTNGCNYGCCCYYCRGSFRGCRKRVCQYHDKLFAGFRLRQGPMDVDSDKL